MEFINGVILIEAVWRFPMIFLMIDLQYKCNTWKK